MLPQPSWSQMKAMRIPSPEPMSIGAAICPSRSAASRTNCPDPVASHHSLPAVPPRYRFHQAMSRDMTLVTTTTGLPSAASATSETGPRSSRRGVPPPGGIA